MHENFRGHSLQYFGPGHLSPQPHNLVKWPQRKILAPQSFKIVQTYMVQWRLYRSQGSFQDSGAEAKYSSPLTKYGGKLDNIFNPTEASKSLILALAPCSYTIYLSHSGGIIMGLNYPNDSLWFGSRIEIQLFYASSWDKLCIAYVSQISDCKERL